MALCLYSKCTGSILNVLTWQWIASEKLPCQVYISVADFQVAVLKGTYFKGPRHNPGGDKKIPSGNTKHKLQKKPLTEKDFNRTAGPGSV